MRPYILCSIIDAGKNCLDNAFFSKWEPTIYVKFNKNAF